MSEISINGQSYGFAATGETKVKPLKNLQEVKEDYQDNIVIKDSKGNMKSISADEIDIKSNSWMKPYVGLPKAGDQVYLFVDNQKVEGKVVISEDENDVVTYASKSTAKAKENLDTLAKDTQKAFKDGYDKGSKIETPKLDSIIDKTKDAFKDGYDKGSKIELPKSVDSVINKTKELTKDTIQKVSENISADSNTVIKPEVKKDIQNSVNNIADKTSDLITDVVKEVSGNKLTIGQMDTHQKGNVEFGVNLSNNPTLNISYNIGTKKLEEDLFPLGNDLIKTPHSEILFLSHTVGMKVGPNELSAGYKANIGIEFNRPMEKDFSVSFATMADAGYRPGGDAFLGLGFGLEGRYELDKNMTLYGGPTFRGTLLGDPGKGKSVGVEAGLSVKF